MKNLVMIVVSVLLVASGAQAGLIEHLAFDGNVTATVGANAVLGTAAEVSQGYLALSGAPTTDTAGDDGAVAGNFDWSASDVLTVAFWMKATAGDKGDKNATMISLGSGRSGGNRFDIRLNTNNLRLEVQGGGSTISGSNVADGTWRHIAVVVPYADSTISDVIYYIDGNPGGTFSGGTTALTTGAGPLRVGDGYWDTGRDFKGGIDEVRLYDSVLDAADVAALYAAGTTVPEPATLLLLGCGALSLIRRRD